MANEEKITTDNNEKNEGERHCFTRIANTIKKTLESTFFKLGVFVGRFPRSTIAVSLIVCTGLGLGLLNGRQEKDQVVLWTGPDSDMRKHSEWIRVNFPDAARYEHVIVSAENVLHPHVLRFLARLDREIRNISIEGKEWTDICAGYGVLFGETETFLDGKSRRRRAIQDGSLRLEEKVQNSATEIPPKESNANSSNDKIITIASINTTTPTTSTTTSTSTTTTSTTTTTESPVTTVIPVTTVLPASKEVAETNVSYEDDSGDVYVEGECLFRNILQLWGADFDKISKLTPDEISKRITEALEKGSYKGVVDVETLLSGVQRDSTGRVSGAKATWLTYLVSWKSGVADVMGGVAGAWEKEFLRLTVFREDCPPGVEVQGVTARSYDDGIAELVDKDLPTLCGGFAILIVYVAIMLGRFNLAQQRIYLALMGVGVVGLSIMASYGLCSAIGLPFGPVQGALPFLLLGIGVDNMFVLIQALNNLTPLERTYTPAERIGLALAHSGVSITASSFTDIVAFAIGSTTIMPALRLFCLFAVVGVLMLYTLQITFFVACTVLDEMRVSAGRDACICMPLAQEWKPNPLSQKDLLQEFIKRWFAPTLFKPWAKAAVILTAIGFFILGLYGTLQWENNFDRLRYLKQNSHTVKFFHAIEKYFPMEGEKAGFFLGTLDYIEERQRLNTFYNLILDNPYVNPVSVKFWFPAFQNWLVGKNQTFPTDRDEFQSLVTEYLFFVEEGQSYIQDLKFDGSPFDDFNITVSRIRFNHHPLNNASMQYKALLSLRSMKDHIHFTSSYNSITPFPFSQIYITWEANTIIGSELLRNLGLTLVAVGAVTLCLLPQLQTAFWVMTMVAIVLTELAGISYFWGLSVEPITSISLILAAGLAVDYSIHVAHEFTHGTGTSNERGQQALTVIGPAVLNGGLSTLLAFILFVDSDAYVFVTFFRLFLLVVIFGIFHALMVLPVVLSIFGPRQKSNYTPQTVVIFPNYNNAVYPPKRKRSRAYSEPFAIPLSSKGIENPSFQLTEDQKCFIHLTNTSQSAVITSQSAVPKSEDLPSMTGAPVKLPPIHMFVASNKVAPMSDIQTDPSGISDDPHSSDTVDTSLNGLSGMYSRRLTPPTQNIPVLQLNLKAVQALKEISEDQEISSENPSNEGTESCADDSSSNTSGSTGYRSSLRDKLNSIRMSQVVSFEQAEPRGLQKQQLCKHNSAPEMVNTTYGAVARRPSIEEGVIRERRGRPNKIDGLTTDMDNVQLVDTPTSYDSGVSSAHGHRSSSEDSEENISSRHCHAEFALPPLHLQNLSGSRKKSHRHHRSHQHVPKHRASESHLDLKW